MSKATLGRAGELFSWIVYLLLLYALLCAYISGGSDVLRSLLADFDIHLPRAVSDVLVVFIFGAIVYRGISSVDIINRLLIGVKLLAYVILVVAITPYMQSAHVFTPLHGIHMQTMMVMMTSFGYAIIVPSLRTYFKSHVGSLKKVIFFGSLLPFIVYLIWIVVVQGLIPREGVHGLFAIANSGQATSSLMVSLDHLLHFEWIKDVSSVFISVCVLTSFLGVSLCLTDFMADGLQVKKTGKGGLLVFTATFLPPLLIVILAPGIFIKALSYAGLFCVLLLILLPLLMLVIGRYKQNRQSEHFRVFGGWLLPSIGLLFAIVVIVFLLVQYF